MFKSLNKFRKDKSGVFGLTSVQLFFGTIMAVALLAYVIVIIMGTLSTGNIIPQTSSTYVNESVTSVTQAGKNLAAASFSNPTCSITGIVNSSNGATINAGNYTATNCRVAASPTSTFNNTDWKVTYSATYDSNSQMQLVSILGNTSTGITSFFGAINPVYAILAVLVIILVLVVLVRVVQAPASSESRPQL